MTKGRVLRLGSVAVLLSPGGCSAHSSPSRDGGGGSVDAASDVISVANPDAGWPECTDDMAVDPNPEVIPGDGGLLLPPNIAPLHVTRPGTSGVVKIRDTYIAPAPNETTPDGLYYLTGTTADMPDAWSNYDGIELWSSPDLQNWTYLGFIWTFSVDARAEPNAWFATPHTYTSTTHNGGLPYTLQVVWAPEIHYIKGNWYIPFSMPGAGSGILKSATGKPTGPYRNALPFDTTIAPQIDPDLFLDTDGTVYFINQKGNLAPMAPDLSGLAGGLVPQVLTVGGNPNGNDTSHAEGAFMFKAFDNYYVDVTLTGTLEINSRYSAWLGKTPNNPPTMGPYSKIDETVPLAGHNNFFKDKMCRWWSTMFGDHNIPQGAPFNNEPGIVPVEFDSDHNIRVDFDPRPSSVPSP
jgi:xylan 1,4-beta-xylosidase